MLRPTRSLAVKLIAVAGLVAGALALLSPEGSGELGKAVAQEQVRRAPGRPPVLAGLDPRAHRRDGDALVSELADGSTAVLTLDPDLQEHVASELARFEVPYAGVVAIEPASGRVLAYVSHSSADPSAGDVALDAAPPTASVFKIITAAALLDVGVDVSTEVCYHGGASRIRAHDLEDSDRDRSCATLAEAVGGSLNVVFAKLADRHLDSAILARYAGAFGFGQGLPFDVPTPVSAVDIPDQSADRLEFARTAAGFWHVHMSPLHGALIAATFANGGRMPRATIVDHVVSSDGEVRFRHEPGVYRAVISRRTARAVSEMMERTVTRGTARGAFFDAEGRAFLPEVRVAGKTGSLSDSRPYRGYTWWVGFAPADEPTIAVAALVVNTPVWRIKASYVARETLREYVMRR
jgi:cell division protein FtsI/penicillin-binding protein 2